MRSEGLWHLVENIFGYLDCKTVVKCRKVSKLWHESLEWISLVKFLLEFGDKLAKYHRSVLKDPEEKVLAIISGWKKGVQKYERTASIEDLRDLKNLFGKPLEDNMRSYFHFDPIKGYVTPIKMMLLMSNY